jgi:gamma-glutamyltranspeptidase/glutathione hydrolase
MSTKGVVSSGHYLATRIGIEILHHGGNAMDAAAATGFALALLQPHQNGIGGEAPMLVYSASDLPRRQAGKSIRAISGHGIAPAAATIERFREYGLEVIPGDGFLPAIVPSAVASYILLLERFGTMRLAEVLAPAVQLAREGFAMYEALHKAIARYAERFREEWPSSAEVFLPGGGIPEVGTVWRNPDWAAALGRLIAADQRCKNRTDGLKAAYDDFYRGKIAEFIVEFCGKTPVRDASLFSHTCLLSMEDFDRYRPAVEEPVKTSYGGVTVYKCSSWTQGPVLLQTLNLLENYNLKEMEHNSPDYIHTVVECMKLAFADREFYYGDPQFVDVPFDRLLSKDYARKRSSLVEAQASYVLRPGGHPEISAENITDVNKTFAPDMGAWTGDTTKVDVIDQDGNMVSVTPSGGWLQSSPVIPGLGFPLGTRGQIFSLVKGHPNCLQPGKRPRSTLSPTLAMKDDEPFMVFGSPGGDVQDQWALQFFLNVIEFGMSLQEAVEAPTFWTAHFPSSFYPRKAAPGSLNLEGRIPEGTRESLASRGHKIHTAGEWAGGNTLAASIEGGSKVRCAAASPRFEAAYAEGL